ncbi:MarR family winged helix-turn-helix transcriptional regulator [Microbacterium sp.]|uniref:MarR family winged helix-turn-helix transcriptional regulator n=1 Tax=Microbacterium sp. TaxID=51671 RepID=UPI003A926980
MGADVISEPLPDLVDPENFTPRLLALVSNALVWRESRELRRRFGLGTNEWRVLSALATRPGSSASEISDFLVVNKAIVSKSVSTLVAHHLVLLSDGPRGSRPLFLTRAGADMHHRMRPISTSGQDLILEGMSDTEIAQFNGILHRMLAALHVGDAAQGDLID